MEHEKLINRLLSGGREEELEDAFGILRNIEPRIVKENGSEYAAVNTEGFRRVHELNRSLRKSCGELIRAGNGTAAVVDLYRRSLLFDAPYDLDAYCIYLEWERAYENKFYEPRRKQLLPLVRKASGLILEDPDPESQGVIAGLSLEIPVLIGAGHATHILKSGAVVTLDSADGTVTCN